MGGEWSEKKGVGLVGGGGDGGLERFFFFFVMWILVAFCWFGTLCSRYPSAGVGLGIDFVSISTYLIMSDSSVGSGQVSQSRPLSGSVAASYSPLLSCL